MTLIFRSRLLIATSFPKEQPPLIVSRQYHRTPIRGTVMPSSARSEGVREPFIARQMDDGAWLPAPATRWRVGLTAVVLLFWSALPHLEIGPSKFPSYLFSRSLKRASVAARRGI